MRGFLAGSLALIAVEALLRNADGTGALIGFLGDAVYRFLSPEVALVPNFAARKAPPPAASSPSSTRSTTTNPTLNTTRAAFITA